MRPSLANKLKHLLGSGCLPASACGAPLLRELQPLLQSGLVARERHGGGWRYVVRNEDALRTLLARRLPSDVGPETGRVAGVARFRDSKATPNDTPPVVLARVFRDVLRSPDGLACPAVEGTRRHGVFAFILEPRRACSIEGSVALVENPAVFLRVEELGLDVDMAIATQGRAHGRLVEWLATQAHPGFRAWHLPDYDPTGLGEFVRLRGALGGRVALYQPPDLAERFARHSSPRLLEGLQSQETLARLRAHPLPEIQAVVNLIDQHNGGLEQESLLVALGAASGDTAYSPVEDGR